MAAYIVATTRVRDQERFADYGRAVAGLSDRHGGETLVRGTVAEILEGATPPGERVIVIRFANAEAARAYIASADYQAAKAVRAGAADIEMRLVVD